MFYKTCLEAEAERSGYFQTQPLMHVNMIQSVCCVMWGVIVFHCTTNPGVSFRNVLNYVDYTSMTGKGNL